MVRENLIDAFVQELLAKKNMSPSERCSYEISQILNSAATEWVDIMDFVWKSHYTITHEQAIEAEKVTHYFPDIEKHAEIIAARAAIHKRRWDNTYPYMISSGNLFSTLSLFEAYILRLAIATEQASEIQLSSINGAGVEKIFNYFRKLGIPLETIAVHEPIKCAQKIRNCLMHAGGLLQLSKDADTIRTIVERKSYLCSEDRGRYTKSSETELVSIRFYFVGEKASIEHDYPHLLCNYISRYIQILGEKILIWLEAQRA